MSYTTFVLKIKDQEIILDLAELIDLMAQIDIVLHQESDDPVLSILHETHTMDALNYQEGQPEMRYFIEDFATPVPRKFVKEPCKILPFKKKGD